MIPTFRKNVSQFIDRFLGHPLIQRVMRNTGYLFSAQTISAALSMGQGILAARLLGTVASVVFGGVRTLVVVAGTAWRAPQLRKLDRV